MRFKGLTFSFSCLKRELVVALAVLLFLTIASSGMAADKTDQPNEPARLSKYLSLGVKTERLVNSHTSYEFGDPYPPYPSPLSKLVFPMDSWWGGLNLRFTTPRFSVNGELLTNVVEDTHKPMKDYDWFFEAVSIYSESKSRLKNSYRTTVDADIEVADLLGLPGWLSLRPVVGFRYQRFQFLIHDGTQYDYENSNAIYPLPGNLLSFRQEYFHYFTGLRSLIDAGRYTGLPDFTVSMQVDYAYVHGNNKDHHLLRGNRFTYENTDGHAWHLSAGLKKSLIRNLFLGVHADYMKIRTTGTHRLEHKEYDMDKSWSNGVKVWSEQTAVGMTLEYRF